MGELRCKTPELVRKEVWTHILAYNLIRTVMAQAAVRHGVEPRSVSFTGAMQSLEAFQPLLEYRRHAGRRRPVGPVPRLARCHRHPPGGRPPRPVRAAGEKTETQSLRLADQAPRRDETQNGQRRCIELRAIRGRDRRVQGELDGGQERAYGHDRARMRAISVYVGRAAYTHEFGCGSAQMESVQASRCSAS